MRAHALGLGGRAVRVGRLEAPARVAEDPLGRQETRGTISKPPTGAQREDSGRTRALVRASWSIAECLCVWCWCGVCAVRVRGDG